MAGKLYIILKALNVLSEEFLHKTCTEMRISVKNKIFTRKICDSHKLEMRKEAAQE